MLSVKLDSSVTCDRGEPHVGERPDRSPGGSASEAGLRSDAVATDRREVSTEIRKASRARAPDSPMLSEGKKPERAGGRRTWDGETELSSEKLAWV
jgi:hypothetical protein